MSNFALTIPAEDKNAEGTEGGAFKSYLRRLMKGVGRYSYECRVEKTVLYNNVTAYLIYLPFSICELPRLDPTKAGSAIRDACLGNNVKSCFVAPLLREFCRFDISADICHTGRLVYKSLLLETLKEIYSDRGVMIGDLDIVIIQGKHVGELISFVRMLSSAVKYITVLVNDRKPVEEEAQRVFVDSGLSIGLTADYKNCLKNTQLIINLCDGNESMLSRANPNALILNFGELNLYKVTGENVIINGVELTLPHNIASRLPDEVFRIYGPSALAGIMLCSRVEMRDRGTAGLYDYLYMKKLYEAFLRDSFGICAFIGRRGILKSIDSRIYGSMPYSKE